MKFVYVLEHENEHLCIILLLIYTFIIRQFRYRKLFKRNGKETTIETGAKTARQAGIAMPKLGCGVKT